MHFIFNTQLFVVYILLNINIYVVCILIKPLLISCIVQLGISFHVTVVITIVVCKLVDFLFGSPGSLLGAIKMSKSYLHTCTRFISCSGLLNKGLLRISFIGFVFFSDPIKSIQAVDFFVKNSILHLCVSFFYSILSCLISFRAIWLPTSIVEVLLRVNTVSDIVHNIIPALTSQLFL